MLLVVSVVSLSFPALIECPWLACEERHRMASSRQCSSMGPSWLSCSWRRFEFCPWSVVCCHGLVFVTSACSSYKMHCPMSVVEFVWQRRVSNITTRLFLHTITLSLVVSMLVLPVHHGHLRFWSSLYYLSLWRSHDLSSSSFQDWQKAFLPDADVASSKHISFWFAWRSLHHRKKYFLPQIPPQIDRTASTLSALPRQIAAPLRPNVWRLTLTEAMLMSLFRPDYPALWRVPSGTLPRTCSRKKKVPQMLLGSHLSDGRAPCLSWSKFNQLTLRCRHNVSFSFTERPFLNSMSNCDALTSIEPAEIDFVKQSASWSSVFTVVIRSSPRNGLRHVRVVDVHVCLRNIGQLMSLRVTAEWDPRQNFSNLPLLLSRSAASSGWCSNGVTQGKKPKNL